MPEFETNPLEKLAFQATDADAELDLRGQPIDSALESVEVLLNSNDREASYFIRFDPASGDGKETLFLPLGRVLLQARKDRRLKRCLPMSDGAGYYIAF